MVCQRKLRGEWLVMEVNLVVEQLDYVLSPSWWTWSPELCLCLCCSCFVLLWNEKKWRKSSKFGIANYWSHVKLDGGIGGFRSPKIWIRWRNQIVVWIFYLSKRELCLELWAYFSIYRPAHASRGRFNNHFFLYPSKKSFPPIWFKYAEFRLVVAPKEVKNVSVFWERWQCIIRAVAEH